MAMVMSGAEAKAIWFWTYLRDYYDWAYKFMLE